MGGGEWGRLNVNKKFPLLPGTVFEVRRDTQLGAIYLHLKALDNKTRTLSGHKKAAAAAAVRAAAANAGPLLEELPAEGEPDIPEPKKAVIEAVRARRRGGAGGARRGRGGGGGGGGPP